MPAMNIFEADAFSLASLTAAIQAVPFQPGRIAASGLFATKPVTTLSTFVEQYDGVLSLVPVSQRGGPAVPATHGTRSVRSFKIPSIKQDDVVGADEITGIRTFGSETEVETLARVVGQRLAAMRSSIEYTIESHRLAAIMGNYYDAAGNAVSLFTEFGVLQQTEAMVLGTDTTKVREKCMNVIEKVEDALGGLSFSGVRALCGKTFWAKLIDHPFVRDTYLNTQMAGSLRGDPRQELDFGGIIFERYRGTSAVKVPDAEAFAFPEGVNDLFITAYAPADYIETAGTLGQSMYAKQWETEGGRGVKIEAQSNPLNLCTRPRTVVKLTTN